MNSEQVHGKIRGKVVSNSDSENRGRLRVQLTLGGAAKEVWAEACVPYAGGSNGINAIPPAGAGVWLEFLEGDINKPVWTGCWWKDGELNGALGAEASKGAKPLLMQSTGRHRILLSGEAGGEAVIIETARGEQGPRIVMTDSSIKISCGPRMSIEITNSEVKINDDGLVVR